MKQIVVDNYVTNYYITEDGMCFNSKTKKYLKGQISNSGYLNYNLSLPGSKRRLYAHRLVAQAYLNNSDNLPEVNHKDGNKLNNNKNNLEWVTSKQNSQHSVLLGLTSNRIKVYQFDKDLKLIRCFNSISEAAACGYNCSMISQELGLKEKTLTLGYYWNDKEVVDFNNIQTNNSGIPNQVRQLDLNGNVIAVYQSMGEAARAIGGSHSHISECCRGKIKTYKGYKWEKIK